MPRGYVPALRRRRTQPPLPSIRIVPESELNGQTPAPVVGFEASLKVRFFQFINKSEKGAIVPPSPYGSASYTSKTPAP